MDIISKFKNKSYLEIANLYEPKIKIDESNYSKNIIIAKSLYLVNDFEKSFLLLQKLDSYKISHETKYLMSLVAQKLNNINQAFEYLNQAISLNKNDPQYLNEMGVLFMKNNQTDQAFKIFIELNKTQINLNLKSQVLHNIALCYGTKNNFEDSIVFFNKSLEINKNNINSWQNLGLVYYQTNQYTKARKCFNEVLKIEPNYVISKNSIALIDRKEGNYLSAIKNLNEVVKINPNFALAWMNLAQCYYLSINVESAQIAYLHAIQKLNKTNLKLISNYLYSLNYTDHLNNENLLNEHLKYGKLFEKNNYPSSNFLEKINNSKIKLGFISADFQKHSVMEFFLPMLDNINYQKFEIYCFSNNSSKDEYTKIIETKTNYVEIFSKTDDQVYQLIKNLNIDVLFDLSGHTAGNRLGVFGKRASPIQISWIGYPHSTGIKNIDYKFIDNFTDPKGHDEFYTEKLIRFPNFFMCFKKPDDYPIELIKSLDRYIFFGSFNNTIKLSKTNIKVWSKIISSNPKFKLCLKHKSLDNSDVSEYLKNEFRSNGVKDNQLVFYGYVDKKNHFEFYNQIHICLDTFPYNGTTTTLEALWMGVPVLTLAGNNHRGRVSHSILNNIGASELSVKDTKSYIEKAIQLAGQLETINKYKLNLRNMLLKSKIMDHKNFTEDFEKIILNLLKQ